MRLCCSCFSELLDKETVCPICHSNTTLNDNQTKELYRLVQEIRKASKFKRNFLKKDFKYELAFKYIRYREEHPRDSDYSYPKILDFVNNNDTYESHEEYWDRINQHTINKNELQKPIVECPYCHSIDTKKILGFSKAAGVAVFGILAVDKMGKQWHCNHCGSDF